MEQIVTVRALYPDGTAEVACRRASACGRNPFVDVTQDRFYYDAVLWAAARGITLGIDATHFMPNRSCTRGQVATFLFRESEG